MQNFKEPTINQYLNDGNLLKKHGKLTQAINKYEKALHLKPDYIPALFQLGEIYEKTQQFDQAIVYYQKLVELQPDEATVRANLARVKQKLGDIQGAIATYIKALACPQPPAMVYQGWGDVLEKNGQLTQAIRAYKDAIKLKPDQLNLYLILAKLYFQRIPSKVSEIINLQKPISKVKNKSIYSQIWEGLNQLDLESLDGKDYLWPKKLDKKEVIRYFTQTCKYKVLDLNNLSKEDEQYIENVGLSVEYLNLNKAYLITKNGVEQESENCLWDWDKANIFPTQVHPRQVKHYKKTQYQISMIKEGCIYAICPWSGKVLKSNDSLVSISETYHIFYRFSGREIFYLITGNYWNSSKQILYFPKTDLIVDLDLAERYKETELYIDDLNRFKGYLVTNWNSIKAYLLNFNKNRETVVLINTLHFAHHLMDELGGLGKLNNYNCLNQVDKFLVAAEPFGKLNEIFPAIKKERIKRIFPSEKKSVNKILAQEILENNFFAIRVGGFKFVTEELANQIYHISVKKCNSAFLAEVEQAKQKHFPVLWITIRLGLRTWISQVEGIANIIVKLWQDFPNLGVIIDGFSLPCGFENDSSLIKIIKNETETVRKIKALLPPEIKVYDTVGCMLYESIVWSYAVDLYLAHHGTLQHKIGWIANKTGVVHTNCQSFKINNPDMSDFLGLWVREKKIKPIYISEDYITDVVTNVSKKAVRKDLNNYECDWKVMYKELFELASLIKRADFNSR
ncbi:Tetratricopeptide TPR_2 repeat protein [Gloeothece citriformis PCC 7424]|uniref:Tetratricopeptide TPR_2 repeat protein n=1 Tax=Gloeothece citriformis (strain PCC 7424) TaxID=65393 RepID=B7KEE1_GLOC7|nr:tetratricopeptide repeat protein [Gloeothece citriformis]ACK73259.1 Tetratricopeptide TPR_2 repeat protein [Gloeothece citriformis PCC 7424]